MYSMDILMQDKRPFMHKKEIRSNNFHNLFLTLEFSKLALLVAINTVENLIYSEDLQISATKEISKIKSIITRIDTVQRNIDKAKS